MTNGSLQLIDINGADCTLIASNVIIGDENSGRALVPISVGRSRREGDDDSATHSPLVEPEVQISRVRLS
jgi:hypothetical protein